MKIGVLGTGMVGQAIAGRLVELGHDVVMGAREATNPKAAEWAAQHPGGRAGTFADAAGHGELVVNATSGANSLAALAAAGGAETLGGTVLMDVANPLDHSRAPIGLTVADTDSLGEQIQRAYPQARVVKALNTVNADVMVHPERVPGEHTAFLAGDDPDAKRVIRGLLVEFGWHESGILDLGGIESARGMEMYLRLWLSMMAALGTARFNVRVVRG